MFEPLFSSEPNFDFFGNLFFFVAMLGGLGHTIMGRELVKKYNPLGLTFWSFAVGTVCFLPLMIHESLNQSILSTLTVQSVTGILYGAVFCSAIGYFLFFWALKSMQAAETGVFVYIDPIVTVMVALPLLGEKPDIYYIIGSIFVFLGIYVAEGRIHYHPLHLLRHKD
jgi:drug/metabolite transporter (DMT)-like permease